MEPRHEELRGGAIQTSRPWWISLNFSQNALFASRLSFRAALREVLFYIFNDFWLVLHPLASSLANRNARRRWALSRCVWS
jgi:hypothetical protein